MDILKASQKLSKLELQVLIDNLIIDVLWFRAMEIQDYWVLQRHNHSSYEFHFICQGECTVILDDGEFQASAGEFYLTGPGVYHEQIIPKGGNLLEYALNCNIKVIDKEALEGERILNIFNKTRCKPFKDTDGCIDHFNKALSEAYNERLGFYNNIKNIVTMIITMAARGMNELEDERYDIRLKNKGQDYRFIQIKKYIEDNIGLPITTEDIARYMYLSNKQIGRIVKSSKGQTTKEFIINIKLQKAKELLKDTKLSIKEIAEVLGFSSEYYFSQFFKRRESYPPYTYRKYVQELD